MERSEARQVLASLCPDGLQSGQPVLGIFTHATGAKRYDAAWWAQFLAAFDKRVSGVRWVHFVAAHGSSPLAAGPAPFYTRNLRRMASLIGATDGFISADCGVMHLAAGSGAPTLGLFHATDPAKYAPYGGPNMALVTTGITPGEAGAQAAAWFLRSGRQARLERLPGPASMAPAQTRLAAGTGGPNRSRTA